jgi:hypothetical protein
METNGGFTTTNTAQYLLEGLGTVLVSADWF